MAKTSAAGGRTSTCAGTSMPDILAYGRSGRDDHRTTVWCCVNDDAPHQPRPVIEQAAAVARHGKGAAAPPGERPRAPAAAYYRHVATEDLVDRSRRRRLRRRASHHQLGRRRPQGTATVRVYTPTVAEHGWSAAATPSSRSSPTTCRSWSTRSPWSSRASTATSTWWCTRSSSSRATSTGQLHRGPRPTSRRLADAAPDIVRESWMHVEIDRLTDAEGIEARERGRCATVLGDVREAVEDWRQDAGPGARDRRRPRREPAAAARAEVAEGRRCSRWLADDHFTFLGYREYELERCRRRRACSCGRCPAPGSASCAPTRTCRRRFGGCRPRCKRQGPREAPARAHQGQLHARPCTGRLPRLRRASRCSTRTARSSASAGSSACSPRAAYTESRDADPGDPREGQRGARAQPASTRAATTARRCWTSSRPTRATSSSRPRSTSCADREAVLHTARAARRCGCSCAATPTTASCRAWSTCRATATPPRPASDRGDPAGRELGRRLDRLHREDQRVDCWRALHFVVRMPEPARRSSATSTPPTSSAG